MDLNKKTIPKQTGRNNPSFDAPQFSGNNNDRNKSANLAAAAQRRLDKNKSKSPK